MNKARLLYLTAGIIFIASCDQVSKVKKKFIHQDTTINTITSYNNLFLDSLQVESFIASHKDLEKYKDQFFDFYKHRNYEFAWFDTSGLIEQAHNFYNLQNDYITQQKDSSIYSVTLNKLYDSLNAQSALVNKSKTGLTLQTELLLTGQFFAYASKVYQGSDINAADLGWFIPRKKIDISATLDTLIKNKGTANVLYEPLNKQYRLLEKYLVKYYDLETKDTWDSIPAGISLKKGDSSVTVRLIKQRLFELGDLNSADSTNIYDTLLLAAVKHFQKRVGLPESGLIGSGTFKELNVRPADRVQQLLVNMERSRWMLPDTLKSDYLLVNIPEFKLHVYQDGKEDFNMNCVVGTAANSTVIFSGNLKYIVFNPYWNVPSGILQKEVLPGMKRNPNYLASHNMEVTGYSGKTPIVRQKSGSNNSLGLVKFLFPNNYDIYLHDTPNKDLFSLSGRAFSHGCIRLSEPAKLAQFLLRRDSLWTMDSVKNSMNGGKEKWITLKQPVPVTIGYFTAWVNADGDLNFRKDIYGHDKKMAEKLFVKK